MEFDAEVLVVRKIIDLFNFVFVRFAFLVDNQFADMVFIFYESSSYDNS